MNELTDIPKSEVPSVVEEALRDNADSIKITKQANGKYTVAWE